MERLSKFFIIFRKEIAGYFNSMIAYVFLIIFTLLNGGLFMTQFFLTGRVDMRALFFGLPFLLCVFLPAVSMRLWAEERRGNTHELLLTFPVRPSELVLGKFFASFAFYVVALLCTLPIPVMLVSLGRPDMGAVFGGYFGAAFLGGFFLAIGILISGFCRDQIVAFILSMVTCFGFYFFGTEFVAASMDGWVAGAGSFLRHYLGTADHFAPFCKGVIDNRDVLYFLVGTAACLVLNGFWIEGRMRPKARSIFTSAALLCAGIFLLANWLVAELPLGRFDLTDGQVYTIAKASKKILRELKSPVLAKFYISPSDKMPTSMKTLERDVRDKLDELRLASKGKFQYKVFYMDAANIVSGAPDKKEETLEAQISKKGIQPFQVESIQSDEVGVRLIYSALSLSYKEKADEILPRVFPGNFDELEYSILSKIYRMTLAEMPKIVLAAPYEKRSLDPSLVAILQQLGAAGQVPEDFKEDNYEFLEMGLKYEGYPVARVDLTKPLELPAGTKTLAVIEPSGLTEQQKYEINQFLHQGGSMFLAVQNYEYNYRPVSDGVELVPNQKKPEVNDLLSAWGFSVDTQVLADEQNEAITMTRGGGALYGMAVPVRFPVQILLTAAEMNTKLSITSRLSAMFYLWGSALKIDPAKVKAQGLKVDTLLTSTKNSWTVPFNPKAMTAANLVRTAAAPKGPFPLAVLAQGQFADAFNGKEPADEKTLAEDETPGPEVKKPAEKDKKPAVLKQAPGKLILMGAATPFQKQLLQGGGHLNFFLNSIDILTLGDELIGIRSKTAVNRTLPKISAPAKAAWRFFATLLVPVLIALGGFARFYWRRRSQRQYLKNLTST